MDLDIIVSSSKDTDRLSLAGEGICLSLVLKFTFVFQLFTAFFVVFKYKELELEHVRTLFIFHKW